MVIAVDFDGTCTTHNFPHIGEDIGAARVLRRLVDAGHQLILYTMRSDRDTHKATGDDLIEDRIGAFLTEAENWFKENGIPLYGVQCNPTQCNWTTSPKCFAQLYIDDAALGCPLLFDPKTQRHYVNWSACEAMLESSGILPMNYEYYQPIQL